MAKEQTAILLLNKEWVNGAALLVNEGKPSASTAATHYLIAPFDCSDDHGVWINAADTIKNILTEAFVGTEIELFTTEYDFRSSLEHGRLVSNPPDLIM